MSANLRESYHCFIYGPQSFFVYGLLALSVFCTYISWLYSKSRNSTLLSFYGARSRPWCFLCQVFGILIKIYSTMRKDGGKWQPREAFSERDFAWFASALRVSFWALDTIHEMDKMGRLQLSGQGICLRIEYCYTSRTRLDIQSVPLAFALSFFFFPFLTKTWETLHSPGGATQAKKKRENILQGR